MVHLPWGPDNHRPSSDRPPAGSQPAFAWAIFSAPIRAHYRLGVRRTITRVAFAALTGPDQTWVAFTGLDRPQCALIELLVFVSFRPTVWHRQGPGLCGSSRALGKLRFY